MKLFLSRLARAYADQGPGPTLAVVLLLMAAIGQVELTVAPPHGPTAEASTSTPRTRLAADPATAAPAP